MTPTTGQGDGVDALDSVRRKLIDKGLLGNVRPRMEALMNSCLFRLDQPVTFPDFHCCVALQKSGFDSATVKDSATSCSNPLAIYIQLRERVEFTFQKQFWDGSNWKLEQIISAIRSQMV